MQTSQDMLTTMQTQALEAIRTGQAATLEAVKNWSETVAKMVEKEQRTSVETISSVSAMWVSSSTPLLVSSAALPTWKVVPRNEVTCRSWISVWNTAALMPPNLIMIWPEWLRLRRRSLQPMLKLPWLIRPSL